MLFMCQHVENTASLVVFISSLLSTVVCSVAAHSDSVETLSCNKIDDEFILGPHLAVVHDGQLVRLFHHGGLGVNQVTPATRDTIFTLSSINKAFAGTLTVKLVA